jgi:hypothetical protein
MPNKGHLYEVMKHVRNKYHYAVRRSKKLADSIRAQSLVEAAQHGDIDLLKQMKQMKGSKKQHVDCPDNIDNATGSAQISDMFKTVYEELYNSAGSEEAMYDIKAKLAPMIGQDSILEVNKLTGSVVKEACSRMKPGKADVTESFTSFILLHAPDNLFEYLAVIFRSFLFHGNVTLELLSCAFLYLRGV